MFQAQHDLRDDNTIQPLGDDATSKRSGAVTLVGYLRQDIAGDLLRLYRDPTVDVYVAVRVEDVVDRSSAAGDDAQSMIWVRRDAVLVWHESLSASTFAPPVGADDETGEGGKWPRP